MASLNMMTGERRLVKKLWIESRTVAASTSR